MKIINYELLAISQTLEKYASYKLPQKISYAITRNAINIQSDLDCYNEAIKKTFEKYDEYILKDEDGKYKFGQNGVPLVSKEQADDYAKDISELLNIEIDVNLYTIDISEFDYEDSERYDALSAMDIISLQRVLCEKEKVAK